MTGEEPVRVLPRLFDEAPRWGWEYRHVAPVPPPAERPPVLQVPEPRWAAGPGPAWERFVTARRACLVLIVCCGCLAVATGLYGAGWDAIMLENSRQQGQTQVNYHLAAWPPYLAAAVILGLVAVILRQVVLYARLEHSRRRWMREVAAAHESYHRRRAEWRDAQAGELARAQARFESLPRWYPLRPVVLRRLDVFGGSAAGWQALVMGSGCPLLGAGGQLSVVDFSQDDVARGLIGAAKASGRRCREIALPAQAALVDVFAGMDAAAVADALTDTVHGGEDKPDHAMRSLDARVLGAVTGALDGSLSVERVCAGLRVILRQERLAEGGSLSADEHDRIGGLFGEMFLRGAQERIIALEAMLHPLAPLGSDAGRELSLYFPDAPLMVASVTEDAASLTAALTARLILQLLLIQMRGPGVADTADRTLVVAAADSLPGIYLERLTQLARRRGVRLVLLFRHLRDDAELLLGGADCVFVMRLGNAGEAARAAEFIGREHRFVVHQFTMTETSGTSDSVSTTETVGTQRGATSGLAGGSTSISASGSVAAGRSQGESASLAGAAGRQRVYEFAVEPAELQSLPESMFVFIDSSRRRGPRARVGDCDPRLLLLPDVYHDPAGHQGGAPESGNGQ